MQQLSPISELASLHAESQTISLIDILLILSKRKRIPAICCLGCAAIGLIVASLMPVMYEAETDILAPQPSTSSSSLLMGQVGNLLGLGGASALGMKDPNDVYIAILTSRTVVDALVRDFDLENVYKRHDIALAGLKLRKRSRIESTPKGLISIRVEDRDPRLAAKLANAYVDQLSKQNGRLAYTEASQRRLFFERQLAAEKDALAETEVALKKTELATGVIELQGQTQLALRSVASLNADITNSEIELQSLRSSETSNNPNVISLQDHIQAQKAQLARLQNMPQEQGGLAASISTAAVPQLGLHYVRRLRDVKYHEVLFELLTKQYEAAKIDESKEAPVVQVVDAAVPSHFKSWPPRALITVSIAIVGLFVGVVWTFILEFHRRALMDPQQAYKWSTFWEDFSFR